MSDDDDDDDEEDSNSRVEFPVIRASRPVSPDVEQLMPGEELLPPEPTGKCPADLQERIETMLKKKIDMNFSIQQRKQFRNPSIYEKLIEHLGIEEKGTNYPIVISSFCPSNSFLNQNLFFCLLSKRNSMIRVSGVRNPVTKIYRSYSVKRWTREKRNEENGLKLSLFLAQLRKNRAVEVLKTKGKENPSGIKLSLPTIRVPS